MCPETYSRAEEGLSFCSYRETRTTFKSPHRVPKHTKEYESKLFARTGQITQLRKKLLLQK